MPRQCSHRALHLLLLNVQKLTTLLSSQNRAFQRPRLISRDRSCRPCLSLTLAARHAGVPCECRTLHLGVISSCVQVANLLNRYLGKYVEGLNKDSLRVAVWSGSTSSDYCVHVLVFGSEPGCFEFMIIYFYFLSVLLCFQWCSFNVLQVLACSVILSVASDGSLRPESARSESVIW